MADSKNDYAAFFPHQSLTRIVGKPTFATLLKLKEELKQNASAVHSVLAGALYGHLFLVVTPAQWNNLANTQAFNRPARPAALNIPAGTTAVQAQVLRDTYQEEIRLFNEVRDVEALLKKQIAEAIDEQYLKQYQNNVTRNLDGDIPTILTNLFQHYGQVTGETFLKQQYAIQTTAFDPYKTPVDNIFNDLSDLEELATAAGTPLTDEMKMAICKVIFKKSNVPIFNTKLVDWKHRPAAEQTWANFMETFRTAQEDLQEVEHLPIQDAAINHAVNLMAEKLQATLMDSSEANMPSDGAYYTDISNHLANSTTQNKQIMESIINMQSLLEKQAKEIKALKKTSTTNGKPTKEEKPRQYCWTHGYKFHCGKDCKHKADGHKDEATVSNRMGGNESKVPEKYL